MLAASLVRIPWLLGGPRPLGTLVLGGPRPHGRGGGRYPGYWEAHVPPVEGEGRHLETVWILLMVGMRQGHPRQRWETQLASGVTSSL